jgi:hypothetical protein
MKKLVGLIAEIFTGRGAVCVRQSANIKGLLLKGHICRGNRGNDASIAASEIYPQIFLHKESMSDGVMISRNCQDSFVGSSA